MFYFVKTPWWLKRLYGNRTWNFSSSKKIIYLTFDDGPHDTATTFVLDELKKFNAKATFFCIGKNVAAYPGIYERILAEGHRTGNHTHNHLNGKKTDDKTYFNNILEAAKYIDSDLFRPPYGRMTEFQSDNLIRSLHYKVIMWDVLSADFDPDISSEKCLRNVTRNAGPGSIVIFHDSEKAMERMSYALPKVLNYFTEKGYLFQAIA